MTGFGRGECTYKGYQAVVELSSVNRRQAEFVILLPKEIEALESRVRETIQKSVSRGRLTARITVQASAVLQTGSVQVNQALARTYANHLRNLAHDLNIESPITLELLMRAPGVMQVKDEQPDLERIWPALKRALNRALAGLLAMRKREGSHLARDIKRRIDSIKRAAHKVGLRAPKVLERYRQQLADRLEKLGAGLIHADDDRLLKELVIFADRADISEELARLDSHYDECQRCFTAREPVGRKLDFLAQEMNREINTIGSKANDSNISQQVVILKTELERLREQAQNIE